MLALLTDIGCKTERKENTIDITPVVKNFEINEELSAKLRASIFLLGSLLARRKYAVAYSPGGCAIGSRPIDIHLQALTDLGVIIKEDGNKIICNAAAADSGRVKLRFPSVGATENIILFATSLSGETVIENAASEPEIVDLAQFIIKCGGSVSGAGTDTVRINGGFALKGIEYEIMPDRIEAGSYILFSAATRGRVKIAGGIGEHLTPLLDYLDKTHCSVDIHNRYLFVNGENAGYLKGKKCHIETAPYPGFPTDLQAPLTAYAAGIIGETHIRETVFESRYKHAEELRKCGAKIIESGGELIVNGVPHLNAAVLNANDLRGGACVVCAALAAKGTSEIRDIKYIERGYCDLPGKLTALGGDISKVFVQ
jgi:UDP-N-acetylglucosamine 1-carboxyvinyltransferase